MAINIAELWEKGKYWAAYGGYTQDVYAAVILLGVALGAFACGRLSVIQERAVPVAIQMNLSQEDPAISSTSSPQKEPDKGSGQGRAAPATPGSVVGSRNGTKYHHPWCSGARTIKEENKIWFASEADAQAAGYTKAGNCK